MAPETSKKRTAQNVGIVARKTTKKVSAGRSLPIWRNLDPDPDPA